MNNQFNWNTFNVLLHHTITYRYHYKRGSIRFPSASRRAWKRRSAFCTDVNRYAWYLSSSSSSCSAKQAEKEDPSVILSAGDILEVQLQHYCCFDKRASPIMPCSFCPSSCWLTCYKCTETGLVCETVNDHGTWWPYLELEGGAVSHRNHASHNLDINATKFGNRTIISFRFITCYIEKV